MFHRISMFFRSHHHLLPVWPITSLRYSSQVSAIITTLRHLSIVSLIICFFPPTGCTSVFLLLDLTAAFNTVNYTIIFSRLSIICLSGTVLSWFTSHFTDRSQFISIGRHTSIVALVTQWVLQGSGLGPLLFMIHIYFFIHSVNFNFHFSANDIQLISILQILFIFPYYCSASRKQHAGLTETSWTFFYI